MSGEEQARGAWQALQAAAATDDGLRALLGQLAVAGVVSDVLRELVIRVAVGLPATAAYLALDARDRC